MCSYQKNTEDVGAVRTRCPRSYVGPTTHATPITIQLTRDEACMLVQAKISIEDYVRDDKADEGGGRG